MPSHAAMYPHVVLEVVVYSHAPGGDLQLVSMPGYGADAFLSPAAPGGRLA